MYRQKESELNAVFRDTSGHSYSVQLKFIWAGLSIAALILLWFVLGPKYTWVVLMLVVIPLKLIFAGLSEIAYLRKAKARQLDGHDDLPSVKSSTMLAALIFGGAILLVSLTMPRDGQMQSMESTGSGLGVAIFLVIIGYRIYLGIFRPKTPPNLRPTEQEARSQTQRLVGMIFGGATLHLIITIAILFFGLLYINFFVGQPPDIRNHLFN